MDDYLKLLTDLVFLALAGAGIILASVGFFAADWAMVFAGLLITVLGAGVVSKLINL